jgi:hypothetical protein
MSVTSKSFLQPLDRVAIALMLGLSLLIGLLLWQGDAVAPRVRDFSWQDKQVGADDTSFTLTFSRPMDIKSVEANLQIDPPLMGKAAWAGRRMAYTLAAPAPYGTSYQVQLQGAQDRFTESGAGRLIQPFSSRFQSRDRALVYLGVEGEEQGRLVLYNLTQQQKTILTPKHLLVVDFKPYPGGEKVLFSATERTSNHQGLLSSSLYTVTTGINPGQTAADYSEERAMPRWLSTQSSATDDVSSGKIDLVLDSKDYQNLKFDLSADGQTIVIQRVNQRNPGEFGLWVVRPNQKPQPLQTEPGGDFMITPDSAAVAVAQGQGVAILSLSEAKKPLDFLPQFGMVLDFAQDGSQAAMVKFNSDYTRSLFLVTNQGVQKQLLRTTGSILSCQFDPLKANLYCLLTQLLDGKTYQEQPYLTTIDLKTGKQTPLVVLPNQPDVEMSLAPDGLALLFDQVVTATTPSNSSQLNVPLTTEGEAITNSRLWLLPLLPTTSVGGTPHGNKAAEYSDRFLPPQLQPEQLPLPGFHPRWLP